MVGELLLRTATARPRRSSGTRTSSLWVPSCTGGPTDMSTSEPSTRPEYLIDYIDEVLVECPECGALATVRAKNGLRSESPRVRCTKCGFNRTGWPTPAGARVTAVTKRRCPRCGRWLEKRYQR